jgi:hypothetical protein
MGNVSSLDKWWEGLEENNVLMSGPQLAFKLTNGRKTVLVFGENHVSNSKCGKNQRLFTDLLSQFFESDECKNTVGVLECYRDYEDPNKIPSTLNSKYRINCIIKDYHEKYSRTGDCTITLNCFNPDKFNLSMLNCMRDVNKDIREFIRYKLLIEHVLDVYCSELKFKKFLMERIAPEHSEMFDRIIPKSHYKKCGKLFKSIQTIKDGHLIPKYKEHLGKILMKVYKFSLEVMDLYAIFLMLITKEDDDILFYGGTLHAQNVINILTHNFGYTITNIGKLISRGKKHEFVENCIRFTKTTNLSDRLGDVLDYYSKSDKYFEMYSGFKDIIQSTDNHKTVLKKYYRIVRDICENHPDKALVEKECVGLLN